MAFTQTVFKLAVFQLSLFVVIQFGGVNRF